MTAHPDDDAAFFHVLRQMTRHLGHVVHLALVNAEGAGSLRACGFSEGEPRGLHGENALRILPARR